MDVGILGIPVIHRHPIESGTEISLCLSHQISGKSLQIGQLVSVVWGDDEAEVMAIVLAPFCEGPMMGLVVLRIEDPSGRAVPPDAVATQIPEVSCKRRSPSAMPDHPRLDHGATRTRGQPAHCCNVGGTAASKCGGSSTPA